MRDIKRSEMVNWFFSRKVKKIPSGSLTGDLMPEFRDIGSRLCVAGISWFVAKD